MPHNLEVKARIPSPSKARRIATALGARNAGVLHQKDTFLVQGVRRLKLRQERGAPPELIYYARSNSNRRSGRISSFLRIPVRSARAIRGHEAWDREHRCTVQKERHLFIYKNCRIHIDTVKDLGNFIEFEVPIVRSEHKARRVLEEMVEAFGLRSSDLIGTAYADMLKDRLQP